MTLHTRKSNDLHHSAYPVLVVRWSKDHRSTTARYPTQIFHSPAELSIPRRTRAGSVRRCGSAPKVQSRFCFVALSGGVPSWEPNQACGQRGCQGERFEQLFEEMSGPNNCRSSAVSVASSGLIKSRTSSSRRGPAARSARRSSTSPAIANLPMKRSWSCLTNCGRAGELDSSRGGVEGHARAPSVECDGVYGEARTAPAHNGSQRRYQARPASIHSSGDGLGILEPGSNTSGGFFTATARSGRARDRAMCPAVARNSWRTA